MLYLNLDKLHPGTPSPTLQLLQASEDLLSQIVTVSNLQVQGICFIYLLNLKLLNFQATHLTDIETLGRCLMLSVLFSYLLNNIIIHIF